MIVFISGGCKNGKSMFAQKTAKSLAGDGKLYYVATMIPYDEEDKARIARHIKEREGWGFETIECGMDILNVLNVLNDASANSTLLLDSVTALLLNEMFNGDFSKAGSATAGDKCAKDLLELSKKVKNIVLVSDYIYSNGLAFDEFTDTYMRALSYVDKSLARQADVVVEICATRRIYHKGNELELESEEKK